MGVSDQRRRSNLCRGRCARQTRADVGRVYGSRFTNSGYNLSVSNLPPGTYDLSVYVHSPLSNTFITWRVVRVTVQ